MPRFTTIVDPLQCGNQNSVFSRGCKRCHHMQNLSCPICKTRGHGIRECPDKWRRYHSTVSAIIFYEHSGYDYKILIRYRLIPDSPLKNYPCLLTSLDIAAYARPKDIPPNIAGTRCAS